MTSRYSASLLWVLPLCVTGLLAQSPTLSETVDTYCSGCHNGSMRSPSGVLLDTFDASHIAENPQVWANAYRQLQAGAMPPVGAPRPNRAAYDAALAEIEKKWGARNTPAAPADVIAQRLASMLWDSAPDEALLADARTGKLRDAAVRERQVKRMLADDRAKTFVARFFLPWLQINTLTGDIVTETEMFLLSQLRADRDPVELWSADYTFVNEALAQHYGIEGISGTEFRRVSLKPERHGLLGQASVLTRTSHPDVAYSSPATRGVWVRRHFFGINPPNPFPNAQPVKPELPITPQTRVLPQDPCVTCHRNFFPLGYALENFDTKGRWRTHDQAGPTDASGAMVDGTKFGGVVEMRRALLERPEAFRTTIGEKLLVFAETGSVAPMSGSPETLRDARSILRNQSNARWAAMIAEVAAK